MNKSVEAIFGLILTAGAVAAWRFWNVDGFLACIVVFTGISMIGHAVGYK